MDTSTDNHWQLGYCARGFQVAPWFGSTKATTLKNTGRIAGHVPQKTFAQTQKTLSCLT